MLSQPVFPDTQTPSASHFTPLKPPENGTAPHPAIHNPIHSLWITLRSRPAAGATRNETRRERGRGGDQANGNGCGCGVLWDMGVWCGVSGCVFWWCCWVVWVCLGVSCVVVVCGVFWFVVFGLVSASVCSVVGSGFCPGCAVVCCVVGGCCCWLFRLKENGC